MICSPFAICSFRAGYWPHFNPYWPLLNLTVAPFAITLEPE
jgi:hypothetical protein